MKKINCVICLLLCIGWFSCDSDPELPQGDYKVEFLIINATLQNLKCEAQAKDLKGLYPGGKVVEQIPSYSQFTLQTLYQDQWTETPLSVLAVFESIKISNSTGATTTNVLDPYLWMEIKAKTEKKITYALTINSSFFE